MEKTYNIPMLNSFKKELYFTVQYGTKLYSTVQYINISVILSSEMSFLTSKTMEKTYNIPILNSFVKKCTFFLYCTVHSKSDNFEYRNGFLDPKNP